MILIIPPTFSWRKHVNESVETWSRSLLFDKKGKHLEHIFTEFNICGSVHHALYW